MLGSGRSGTSMVAGSLSGAGYFMGEALYEPRLSNPKGLFESPVINDINDELISTVLPRRSPLLPRFVASRRPGPGQSWLARLPLGVAPRATPALADRMAAECNRRPFCYKDPRFCYTLPAWRPYLGEVIFICVFRHPASTAASVLKECRDQRYLRTLKIDFHTALDVWRLMYLHVLRTHCRQGEWVFVHFDQMLEGSGARRIEAATGARIDRSFPDPALKRTKEGGQIPEPARVLYEELCERAGWDAGAVSAGSME